MSIFKDWKMITHKGCADGSACAVLFRVFDGETKNIHFATYENVNDTTRELYHSFSGKIILADISVSPDTAQIVEGRKYDFLLIDHHKTALKLNNFSWCEIEKENKRCGSKMLYDWIRHELFIRFDNSKLKVLSERLERYKKFIELIQDYDLWSKKFEKETTDLADLHDVLGQEEFIERFIDYPKAEILSEERFLLNLNKKKKQQVLERAKKEVCICTKNIQGVGRRVGFINVGKFRNEIAEMIYNDPELNVDLVVMLSGNHVSLRAPQRSEIDCSQLAEKFGNGGHLKSAAINTSNMFGKTFLEMIMEKI